MVKTALLSLSVAFCAVPVAKVCSQYRTPKAVPVDVQITRFTFDQRLPVGQVNKATVLEPSQIAMGVAALMPPDGLISAKLYNLLPFVSERIKRGGDKRLVTVMLPVCDFVDIAFTMRPSDWHQPLQKWQRAHEELAAIGL